MKRAIFALLVCLSGCSTIPREALVPVAVPCPAPPELPPLSFPLEALRLGGAPGETVRAFTIIIEMQKTRIDSLEKILEGYKPKQGGI